MSVVATKRVYRKRKGKYYRRRKVPINAVTGAGGYRRGNGKNDPYVPWGSMIGGAIGGLLGGPPGMALGGGVGHLSQRLIKHFSGFGDYSVEVNSLLGPDFSPPELINRSKRGVCLRHREYIGEITAAAAFTNIAYEINPGISTTFPWLSGVANNFEQYAFTGMIFEFKTLSADYTTASSAALGYVAMATQYNSLSADFADKIHMENYEFANSAKPSETFIHPIECKKSLTPTEPLYIRTGPIEDNADIRLYDLGKFQIATGGNSGSGVLGELWCTYEVCLYKPKLVDAEDLILSAHWRLNSVTNASPFGSAEATQMPGTTIDAVLTGGSITFPATMDSGIYQITWAVKGTSATVTGPSWTAVTNCTILARWFADTVTIQTTPSGVASTTFMCSMFLSITGSNAQLVCNDDGTLPTSVTAGDLYVAPMVAT